MGSGKTALVDALCKRLRGRYEIAVVTNDIYTQMTLTDLAVSAEPVSSEFLHGPHHVRSNQSH